MSHQAEKSGDSSQLMLEAFIEQLAEIAPNRAMSISAQSDLISDLGFDSPAFGRLALLLYKSYGIAGLSTASLQSKEHLTVEGFFNHRVLYVLGIDPQPVR